MDVFPNQAGTVHLDELDGMSGLRGSVAIASQKAVAGQEEQRLTARWSCFMTVVEE
jgi:hypothetical protein